MNAYNVEQEYNDLRWGTMMPIALTVGSEIVQVRARGTCSVRVQDAQRLQQQVADPESVTVYVRSLLENTLMDVLGERSTEVSEVAQLTAVSEDIVQALRSNLEPKLAEAGLQVKTLNIEAIEVV